MTDDKEQAANRKPEADAKGQFRQTRHGAHNDGVSSADPEVLSDKESGDATFGEDPKRHEAPRKQRQK